ncbi:hypothetical protein T01_16309 [Trichinella spiralis]|uniref:Uncharacterized protein n=1 Tax=Trichinella spiralis TaxID=6334 RepID=A0A0V1B508_TRISP|nr:hypothetical protein T01_16309 [Trichinella spiralis]
MGAADVGQKQIAQPDDPTRRNAADDALQRDVVAEPRAHQANAGRRIQQRRLGRRRGRGQVHRNGMTTKRLATPRVPNHALVESLVLWTNVGNLQADFRNEIPTAVVDVESTGVIDHKKHVHRLRLRAKQRTGNERDAARPDDHRLLVTLPRIGWPFKYHTYFAEGNFRSKNRPERPGNRQRKSCRSEDKVLKSGRTSAPTKRLARGSKTKPPATGAFSTTAQVTKIWQKLTNNIRVEPLFHYYYNRRPSQESACARGIAHHTH